MYSYNQEEKKVFIWINGKSKEYSTTVTIHSSINSIKRLQDLICQSVKNKYHPDKMIIFNYKGIELDEADLPYIKSNQVLYVSLDGHPFNTVNYVNQYEFVKPVKSGGYGKVYVAANVITNELVAIKRIDTGDLSSEEIYNISREAVYLESFKHSNIIKILLSFLYNNNFYTVMELAKGGELGSYLKEKSVLKESEAKIIFRQIHHAVRYIHSKNVIHRDLNPNNILFLDEAKEDIVLIDFGISGLYSGNVKEKVNAGTIRFVPPEVASGTNLSSSPKIDNWALGIILYLMLFGSYPFDGSSDSEILNKISHQNYKFPKNISISKTCKQIITKFLDKNPHARLDLMDNLLNVWYEEPEESAEIEEEKETKQVQFAVDTLSSNVNHTKSGNAKSSKGVPLINIEDDLEEFDNLNIMNNDIAQVTSPDNYLKLKMNSNLTGLKAKSSNKVTEKVVTKKIAAFTPNATSGRTKFQLHSKSNNHSPTNIRNTHASNKSGKDVTVKKSHLDVIKK